MRKHVVLCLVEYVTTMRMRTICVDWNKKPVLARNRQRIVGHKPV